MFKSKIDFPEEEQYKEQRPEKPKFQLPLFKKTKSVPVEPQFPSFQRVSSFTQPEPKPEPARVEKVSLTDCIGKDDTFKQLLSKKLPEALKSLDQYHENCQKLKNAPVGSQDLSAEPSTIHPSLQEFETQKMARLAELEV